MSGAQGKSQVGWAGAVPGGAVMSGLPASAPRLGTAMSQLPGQNGCGILDT